MGGKWLCRQGKRKCSRCNKIYSLTHKYFFSHKGMGNSNLGYVCKPCAVVWNRELRGNQLSVRFRLLNKFNFTCQYCGRKAPEVQFHIDHIFPKSKGGRSTEENLTLACYECNIGKGTMILK